MPTLPAEQLIALGRAIFAAAGAPEDIAHSVAASLVDANLTGHDSHGIMKVLAYIDKIRSKTLIPTGRPQIEREIGAVALVDCGWGFGQPSARFAAAAAARLAKQYGIGCAALRRVNHIGRLSEYALMLAEAGLVGIVFTSGSMYHGSIAPYGGRERVFGSNPLAWAAPVGEAEPPLVIDFATSGIAIGKILVALSEGKDLPPGMLLDRDGQPTTDPHAFDLGGILLPFGGYKGYGLNLMIELVATLLTDFAPASSDAFQPGNPTVMIALNIEAFTERERFYRLAQELLRRIKTVKPQAGFDEILLPGEPERRAREQHMRTGIAVPESVWSDLGRLAAELGVAVQP